MTKRIVVISDTQMPFEDRRAVKAVINFIEEYQPDEVVQIGDLMDFPQPSRWSKDSRAEFEGSVFKDAEYGIKNFLTPLREAYAGPIGILEGNHDERPRVYLEKYAPALAGTNAFDIDVLMRFDEFEVTLLPAFYEFAKDWVMTHGHVGGINLSPIAGTTARNAAVTKIGKSVVMGHTHRLGISSHTVGYKGKILRTLTGFEVGNLMDMKSAQYLKGGAANWQQGFGILEVSDKHVQPIAVSITNGRFVVDGVTYRV